MIHLDDALLNEYLDGVLNARQQQEVASHLAACGECRAALADLQQLFTALAEVKELPLAADLSARVLADIAPEPESSPWLRPLLIAQMATAVLMLGFLWPTIQNWLGVMGTAVSTAIAALPPVEIAIGERLAAWQTTLLAQLRFPNLPLDLAAAQWGILVALAFAAWLAGNRLLFVNE